MINGIHVLIYSRKAAADKKFFKEPKEGIFVGTIQGRNYHIIYRFDLPAYLLHE